MRRGCVALPAVGRLARDVVDGHGAGEDHARAQHGAPAHDRALVDAAVAAHEHVVLDDHGQRAHRLQHAAEHGAAAERCTRWPTCAQEPTRAWESIMRALAHPGARR